MSAGLRSLARALPLEERRRRLESVYQAADVQLLRAVVEAGVGGGEWRSTSDCAERAFVVEARTLRRWLADEALVLPEPLRSKLERLAFAFGVEVRLPRPDLRAALARVLEQ